MCEKDVNSVEENKRSDYLGMIAGAAGFVALTLSDSISSKMGISKNLFGKLVQGYGYLLVIKPKNCLER